MFKKLAVSAALVVLLALGIWATVRGHADDAGNRLTVTVSFYPIYEFAARVGGDKVHVTNLTPAGAEPHDFEPSAKALAQAQEANVLLYNGNNLEPWAAKFARNYKGMPVKMSDHIRAGADRQADPHYWLDPVLARQMVDTIRDSLAKADPANSQTYADNAREYNRQLAGLDQDFREGLRDCQLRTVILSHQSAGYLAARYGFQVEALSGLSPEAEPAPGRLAEVASLITQKNIHYILFESLVSPRLADTIAKETGAQTLLLDPIEGLADDAQKAGKNYLSIQHNNLGSLRRALACQ